MKCKGCNNFDKFLIERDECLACITEDENCWYEVYYISDEGYTELLHAVKYFSEALHYFLTYTSYGTEAHIDIWRLDADGTPWPVQPII